MATMDKLKIAVVVLNYNGLGNTLDCLDSLAKLEKSKHKTEIVVVDNNSQDGSGEALTKVKDIFFIQNQENLGYTGGNNIGIKYALKRGASHILILNNDTVVDKSLIIKLIDTAKKGDIICPKIYFAPGFEFHKGRYSKKDLGRIIWYAGGQIDWQNIIGQHIGVDEIDHGQYSKSHKIDLATGAAMFVARSVFEKIGLFDDKYFLYLEDMDFCVRAKNANFKIIFEPKAIIWHKNAASSGGSGSKLQDYYITRNRLLFAFRHAPLVTKFALLRHTLARAKDPIKRKALIDFLTLNFGQGSYQIK